MASDIGQSTVQSENKAGVAENKTLTADNDKTYRIDVEKLNYINLFNPLHSLATFCGLSLKVKRPGTWASAASVPLCLLFMVFPWYGKAVILVLLTALCLYVTQKIYTLIGHTNKHRIVCDDLLGMLYTSFGFSIEEWYYLILVLIRSMVILAEKKAGNGKKRVRIHFYRICSCLLLLLNLCVVVPIALMVKQKRSQPMQW